MLQMVSPATQPRVACCIAGAWRDWAFSWRYIEPNIVAEFLAKFLDFHLKKSNFVTTDDQLSRLIEEVLTLFRIVTAKDVFEEFY